MVVIDDIVQAGRVLGRLSEEEAVLSRACAANPWFTPFSIRESIRRVQPWFQEEALRSFLADYPESAGGKRVGLILAGNLPLVGLHDLLMGWLSGHALQVKLSSKDSVLFPAWLANCSEPLRQRTHFCENIHAVEIDALLATGSNNSARYLEAGFRKVPRLLRKNRFSIAVIGETTTDADLQSLAEDILLYDGLGCRSVSSVFVPEGFDLDRLENALDGWPEQRLSPAYSRTLNYEKARLSMLDPQTRVTKHAIFSESKSLQLHEPGTLQIIRYKNTEEWEAVIARRREEIQCLVGGEVLPGEGQSPGIRDFADGVDSYAFLLNRDSAEG